MEPKITKPPPRARMIDEIEWNFTEIPAEDYGYAFLYESSRKIEWINDDINLLWSLGPKEWSQTLTKIVQRHPIAKSVGTIRELLLLMGRKPSLYRDIFLMEELRCAMTADLLRCLGSLPIFVPGFAKPWMAFAKSEGTAKRMRDAGIDQDILNAHFSTFAGGVLQLSQVAAEAAYQICRRFGGPELHFVAQYRQNLANSNKGARKARSRERGPNLTKQFRCLASLRLQRTGLPFEECSLMVRKIKNNHAILPKWEDHSEFSRDVSEAQQMAARLFPGLGK